MSRYVRRVLLLVALCFAAAAWPADLGGQLLGALTGIPAYLSPTEADNAGNSTAILLASALASLLLLRERSGGNAAVVLAALGLFAGFGA